MAICCRDIDFGTGVLGDVTIAVDDPAFVGGDFDELTINAGVTATPPANTPVMIRATTRVTVNGIINAIGNRTADVANLIGSQCGTGGGGGGGGGGTGPAAPIPGGGGTGGSGGVGGCLTGECATTPSPGTGGAGGSGGVPPDATALPGDPGIAGTSGTNLCAASFVCSDIPFLGGIVGRQGGAGLVN